MKTILVWSGRGDFVMALVRAQKPAWVEVSSLRCYRGWEVWFRSAARRNFFEKRLPGASVIERWRGLGGYCPVAAPAGLGCVRFPYGLSVAFGTGGGAIGSKRELMQRLRELS